MRNLTIKRAKSFVGCLKKASVYIEDPAANELVITGVYCRKIGELKNGEEKTFQIEETAAKVFVIMDRLSKDFCNDFYQLSEGKEDLFLSGKNKYSLGSANAFRFDNNNNVEAIANRKRTATKKGPVIVGIILGIGIYVGIANAHRFVPTPEPQDKTFSYQEMRITLTEEFREGDNGENSIFFDSGDVTVFATKEPFNIMYGFEDFTLEEYGRAVLQISGNSTETLRKTGDHITFSYKFKSPGDNITYWYYSVAFKAEDAFWIVQFVVPEEKISNYETRFAEWAETICFSS